MMSYMVKCDCCGRVMHTDSREEKDAFHHISIDSGYYSFHLCRDCYDMLLKRVFHFVWDADEEQFVQEDESKWRLDV